MAYNKNTDYMARMNEAAANGEYDIAALLEQQRNAKIAGEGLDYQQTNQYASYLPQPKQTSFQNSEKYNQAVDKVINYEPFSYDVNSDPLYAQYKEQYTNNGQLASQNTLAQVSARTGGLASSYAGQAAQQTYDQYMQDLNSKIPELYQLAYSKYLQEYSMAQDAAELSGTQNSLNYQQYLDQQSMNQQSRDNEYEMAKLAAQYGDYSYLNKLGIDTSAMTAKSGSGYGKVAATDESANQIKYGDLTLDSVLAYAKTDPTIAMTYATTNWDNMNWGARYALLQAVGMSAADAGKYANLDKASVSTIFTNATQTPEAKTYTKYTNIDSYTELKKWANENGVSYSDALTEGGFNSLKNNAIVSEGEYNRSTAMQNQYGSYANYVALKKQFKSYEDYYDYLQDYLGYITSQN